MEQLATLALIPRAWTRCRDCCVVYRYFVLVYCQFPVIRCNGIEKCDKKMLVWNSSSSETNNVDCPWYFHCLGRRIIYAKWIALLWCRSETNNVDYPWYFHCLGRRKMDGTFRMPLFLRFLYWILYNQVWQISMLISKVIFLIVLFLTTLGAPKPTSST